MFNDYIPALILAFIQGMTEWIPVSSSGHLVLFERILNYPGGLEFEVALHFGTLMAVFVYFGREITDIIRDFLSGSWKSDNGKMAWFLIIASLPAAIIGFFAMNYFESFFSEFKIITLGFALTGVILLIVSITPSYRKDLNFPIVLMIGFAQALAIIPGISRSGVTISTAILLGLSEKKAMKFSFLMAIPIIFGASLISLGTESLSPDLIWATLVSFVVGLITIHFLFNYILISRKNFRWFGIYCLLLALFLLFFII
jgi:undecaprenyl-diphosphatase